MVHRPTEADTGTEVPYPLGPTSGVVPSFAPSQAAPPPAPVTVPGNGRTAAETPEITAARHRIAAELAQHRSDLEAIKANPAGALMNIAAIAGGVFPREAASIFLNNRTNAKFVAGSRAPISAFCNVLLSLNPTDHATLDKFFKLASGLITRLQEELRNATETPKASTQPGNDGSFIAVTATSAPGNVDQPRLTAATPTVAGLASESAETRGKIAEVVPVLVPTPSTAPIPPVVDRQSTTEPAVISVFAVSPRPVELVRELFTCEIVRDNVYALFNQRKDPAFVEALNRELLARKDLLITAFRARDTGKIGTLNLEIKTILDNVPPMPERPATVIAATATSHDTPPQVAADLFDTPEWREAYSGTINDTKGEIAAAIAAALAGRNPESPSPSAPEPIRTPAASPPRQPISTPPPVIATSRARIATDQYPRPTTTGATPTATPRSSISAATPASSPRAIAASVADTQNARATSDTGPINYESFTQEQRTLDSKIGSALREKRGFLEPILKNGSPISRSQVAILVSIGFLTEEVSTILDKYYTGSTLSERARNCVRGYFVALTREQEIQPGRCYTRLQLLTEALRAL